MSASSRNRTLWILAPALAGVLFFTSPLRAADLGVNPQLQRVLDERCTGCHTLERVGIALEQGRDIGKIEAAMLARGAVLSEQDKQVLGTFWGPAAAAEKSSEPSPQLAPPVTAEQARAFEQVIERRCLLCHTRERIDDAIARRLSYESIESMMLKRGAVLTPQESQTLKIFWGQPQRR